MQAMEKEIGLGLKPIESEQLVILKNAVAMAKYDLNRNQQKVFLEIAMMAKNEPESKFYRFYIKQFLKNIGVSTNDTSELKREIEEMRNITIHIPRTKAGGELKANFFASVEVVDTPTNRYIEIEISEKLKPYFIEIADGEFFHYQIHNTRVLKSVHSIRFYLYLKAWRWTKKTVIRYKELRAILGIKTDDYKLFGDFKRRVLDKAREELQKKTDLSFDYTLIREQPDNPNTPVEKIAFVINDNGKTPAIIEVPITEPDHQIQEEPQATADLIKLAGEIDKIEENEIVNMINTFGHDRVLDVLILAKEELTRGNKIRSLTAYLYNALRNKSGDGKSKEYKERKGNSKNLKVHREIETLMLQYLDEFKTHYFIELGAQAPQPIKDAFFQRIQQEINKNRRLEKVYKVKGEWNIDILRSLLGSELNVKSDDELGMLFMENRGTPIERINGYWTYADRKS